MTQQDYGDSGAPALGPVTPQERKTALEGAEERKAAATALDQASVAPPPEELRRMKSFVSAREHANASFLVKAGIPTPLPAAFAAGSSVQPLARREGDKWAHFVGGILVTDDPDIIAWCEIHPKVCRDSANPMTKVWATIKDMQARLSNRDPMVDQSQLDADETVPPNMVGVQAVAAKPGSTGSDLVGAAEASREATERRTSERAAEPGRLLP